MKTSRLSGRALCAALVIALTVPTHAQTGDDARWAELEERLAGRDNLRGAAWGPTAELAWEMFEAHPADARRWNAWLPVLRVMPRSDRDPELHERWAERLAVVETAAANGTDVPRDLLEFFASRKVSGLVLPYTDGQLPADWQAKLVPPIEELAAKFPDGGGAFVYFARLVAAVESQDPAALPALIAGMADSPSPKVRDFAAKRQQVLANLAEPLNMKFVALDGRVVDTATWRDKVVLVDFWTTWCAPCIEAMPHLKALYAKYHEHGLEIVNVSLDEADARPVLEELVAKLELPWPQYFDGKAHATEYAVRYGVQPIPHVLLAGKDGRIVAVNPTKEQLEAEVQRLLGL